MNLNFSENFKQLRKEKEHTQEKIAEILGVTGQTVSRWELGMCYPDIELLPSIANYFHISIDELFGYQNDRRERLENIIKIADDSLKKQGDMKETISTLKNAISEFPSESSLLVRLGYSLLFQGYIEHGARQYIPRSNRAPDYDIEYNTQNSYFHEALNTWDRALKLDITAHEKNELLPLMVRHYALVGEFEKASDIAKKQNYLACY